MLGFPQLTAERDHRGAAPPAQATVERAVSPTARDPAPTRELGSFGKTLTERQADQPPEAVAVAWTAQKRLHRT